MEIITLEFHLNLITARYSGANFPAWKWN